MVFVFNCVVQNYLWVGYYLIDEVMLLCILDVLECEGMMVCILDLCCGEGVVLVSVELYLVQVFGVEVMLLGVEFDLE